MGLDIFGVECFTLGGFYFLKLKNMKNSPEATGVEVLDPSVLSPKEIDELNVSENVIPCEVKELEEDTIEEVELPKKEVEETRETVTVDLHRAMQTTVNPSSQKGAHSNLVAAISYNRVPTKIDR